MRHSFTRLLRPFAACALLALQMMQPAAPPARAMHASNSVPKPVAPGRMGGEAASQATCIDNFDVLELDAPNPVGTAFIDSGVAITVEGFVNAAGALIETGVVTKVNTFEARGSAPELNIASANVRFAFVPPVQSVSFLYADLDGLPPGGRVNLGVNATLTHTNNFPDPAIDAATFPALTDLIKTSAGPAGAVTMTGNIASVRIGGENLRLDRICFERASSLQLTKTVQPSGAIPAPGEAITYVINLRQLNGGSPLAAELIDPLPSNVRLAGPVETMLNGTPQPPSSTHVLSNTVHWRGVLPPDGSLFLRFPVIVRPCVGIERTFGHTATARVAGHPDLQASVNVTNTCWDRPPIDIDKAALVRDASGQLVAVSEANVLNDAPLLFRFVARNTKNVPLGLNLRDALPQGLVFDAQTLGDFEAGNTGAQAQRLLGPNETVTLTLPTRVQAACGRDIVNQGESEQGDVQMKVKGSGGGLVRGELDQPGIIMSDTNGVRLHVLCNDLGDAPDAQNKAGADMQAYPSQTANFPTVYGPVTKTNGPGPLHRVPRPFHLGALVSPEVDADVGPDADGRNNLNTRSAPFSANHDREDDGLRPENLNFASCAATTIPITVAIGPNATALLTATQGTGYLNVWVDGNADGDWADSAVCAGTPGQTVQAHEHIVIDHPINVNALGPGLHRVLVPSQRVPWNAPNAAWLRVSLGDRPSVKTLTDHGDGRGPVGGFATGETEDYLWRNPQSRGPDVQVTKHGAFKLAADGTPAVVWVIAYENIGDAASTGGSLTDDLSQAGPLPPIRVDSGRLAPPLISGSTYAFVLPTLNPGEGGVVIIEQALDGRLHYTNVATATVSADTFAGNNSAGASVTDVVVRPPLIVTPGDGTTCEQVVLVTGRAQPGATVRVFVDGAAAGSTLATATGQFSVSVGPLSEGAHSIYALAELGGVMSAPGNHSEIVVNTTLGWSPLSLRFEDSHGRVSTPRDSSGRTDANDWILHLLEGERYTVSVKLCCTGPSAAATLVLSGTNVALTDADGDGVFLGAFTNTLLSGTVGAVTLAVSCSDGSASFGSGPLLIDPDGVVYDITSGALLPASQVTCLVQNEAPSGSAASFGVWPAALYENQINPQIVGSDAHFAFFTPVGTYRLDAQKAGYQRYLSPDLNVIAEPVHFDMPLTPIQSAPRYTVTISANGYSPAVLRVPKGSVVAFVNVDGTPHSATAPKSAPLNGRLYNFDSGLLQPGDAHHFKFDNPATYTYSDYNSTSGGVIIVEQPMQFLPIVTR